MSPPTDVAAGFSGKAVPFTDHDAEGEARQDITWLDLSQ